MTGPYLIGVDGGTQSSKVVVYDATGTVVSEGRQALRPMSRPRPRGRRPPRRRPVGLDRCREPRGARRLRRRPGRDRGRRPLHDPLLQGLPPGRRLALGAGDQLDGRPRLPAVPARRPRGRLRDDLLGLPHPPLHGRAQGQRRQQHPAAVADRHRHVAVERPIPRSSSSTTCPGRCSSNCSCRATSPAP